MRDDIIKSVASKTDVVFDFQSKTSPQNKCKFETLVKYYRNKEWTF